MADERTISTRESPFHAGELRAQAHAGVLDSITPAARQAVRPYMPEQHRSFYQALPFLVAAARDDRDRPWVTLLTGRPGFARAPTDRNMRVDASTHPGDALAGALRAGADIGLLGIDLASRRRNRMNGKVLRSGRPLTIRIAQAFGNCPQHIHARDWQWVAPDPGDMAVSRAAGLSSRAREWIKSADTLFLASGYRGDGHHEGFGMDASHRGGPTGFVEVTSDTRLIFPDYAGNHFFNTIGNLVMDPRLGVLFVRFDTGALLQITGRASIDWHPGNTSTHPGAQRLVTVDIDEVVELHGVLPLRWSASRAAVRTLRVVDRIRETTDVLSLVLASRDGGPLPVFRAGQHLPIDLRLAGQRSPVGRTYSLSGAPGLDSYRISVKRKANGLVSRYLHDAVKVGDFINAGAPAGDFVLAPGKRPVALVSAGTGVTPMVSMLHELIIETPLRRVFFIHGARDGDHHPFTAEVGSLARNRKTVTTHVAYSRPAQKDVPRRDYDSEGRVDVALLQKLLPTLDADFYLCGPGEFLLAVSEQLEHRGVPARRIRTEDFGNGP